MGGFIYFVPKAPVVTAEMVATLGIRALEGLRIGPHDHTAGGVKSAAPEGLAGCLFAPCYPGPEAKQVAFDPREAGRYEWSPGPERRWWVGVDREARPTPQDLVRPQVTDGVVVQGWRVPICLSVRGAISTLPATAAKNEKGEVVPIYDPKYVDLSKRAEEVCDRWEAWARDARDLREALKEGRDYDVTHPSPSDVELFDLVADALAVNYYVSDIEVGALKLVQFGRPFDWLMALWGYPLLEEIRASLKKKDVREDDSGGTSAGGDAA